MVKKNLFALAVAGAALTLGALPAAADNQCDGYMSIYEMAYQEFASIRGAVKEQSDFSTVYHSTYEIPKASACDITDYANRDEVQFKCRWSQVGNAFYQNSIADLEACFGDERGLTVESQKGASGGEWTKFKFDDGSGPHPEVKFSQTGAGSVTFRITMETD